MELGRGTVCKECLALLRQPQLSRAQHVLPLTAQRQWTSRSFTETSRATPSPRWDRAFHPRLRQTRSLATAKSSPIQSAPVQSVDLNSLHTRIQELCNSVLTPTDSPIPSEQRILYVLEQLESLSASIIDEPRSDRLAKPKSPLPSKQETATSALLGSVNARQYPAFISRASLLKAVSEKAEEMLRHPNVFITPAVLKAYVELQALLQQPSSFPDVFDLYARKPIPTLRSTKQTDASARPSSSSSNGVTYAPAKPNKISSAIDASTANAALQAAMHAHDLGLAIDVVMTSFATPAFRRAKALRQAGIPAAGLAAAPLAAYTLSSQFSALQQTMDPRMATAAAFAGIMTYVGAVSMVGYVAVTTANDQMERVTWATGVPLWERWAREDERAAVDRVAAAWGFKDKDKRGEEEGEEWDSLKEWVGTRGMVLDRVSLMDGME